MSKQSGAWHLCKLLEHSGFDGQQPVKGGNFCEIEMERKHIFLIAVDVKIQAEALYISLNIPAAK